MRSDISYLVHTYASQIAAWRSGAVIKTWRSIAAELARIENIEAPYRPTGSGLRRAWQRPKGLKGPNGFTAPVTSSFFSTKTEEKRPEEPKGRKGPKEPNVIESPAVTHFKDDIFTSRSKTLQKQNFNNGNSDDL